MRDPLEILLWAVLAYMAGGVLSLLLGRNERAAITINGLFGALGGALGLYAVLPFLLQRADALNHVYAGPFPFAHLAVRLDMLGAFMTGVISLLAVAASIYSIAYVREYEGKGASAMGFFMNTFIASMVALMVMDNTFYFIIFFEVMSLSSYFLVIADQESEAVSAGLLYFFIAHAGSVLIMASFFIMYCHTPNNSLDFAAFRQAQISPAMASIAFLLAFFGFGAKAGMLPLHGWLPRAHPAAPSHASAMMSGVMVKIGVFGIIKVGADLLGGVDMPVWWGVVVLTFGAVSSVLGVMYALAEHDIKRLLAYHTVENVGIILMGVGVGLMGLALKNPLLAALGFLGALYHLLNHAVFKGLLFLGAGAIIYKVHTKDMEKMGGLGKRMPRTALAFLVGCMAISALPPLNGFVSEWYTYQGLVSISQHSSAIARLSGPVAIVMLAITGALAAMCFVKVYGISFCGQARSAKAAEATEVPAAMTLSMLGLAALCVVLGVGAACVAPVISAVADSLVAGQQHFEAVRQGVLVPGADAATGLSPTLVMLLLLGGMLLPVLLFMAGKANRLPMRRKNDPWACGYGYEERMALSAGSFTQGLRHVFAGLYRLRQALDPAPAMSRTLDSVIRTARRVEPMWDDGILARIVRAVQKTGICVQRLQQGDFRVYCLYIIIALIALLLIKAA